jgi:hypothetical protein
MINPRLVEVHPNSPVKTERPEVIPGDRPKLLSALIVGDPASLAGRLPSAVSSACRTSGRNEERHCWKLSILGHGQIGPRSD